MKQLQVQKQLQIRAFHYFKPPMISFIKKEIASSDLKDTLLKQLVFLKFNQQEKFFIELMLDALDEEGFLTESYEELVSISGLNNSRAYQLKVLLQNLEPEGLFQRRSDQKVISYEKRIPECVFDGNHWYVFDLKIQGLVKIFYQRNQLLLILTKFLYKESFLKNKKFSYKELSSKLNIHYSTLYRLVKDKYFQLYEKIYSYEEFLLTQKKQVMDRSCIFIDLWKKFSPKTGKEFQKIYMQEEKKFLAIRTINKYRKKLTLV